MINSLGALHGAAQARETKTTFPAQVYSLETWPVSDSTSKIMHIAISKCSKKKKTLVIKEKKKDYMCLEGRERNGRFFIDSNTPSGHEGVPFLLSCQLEGERKTC